MRPVRNVFQKLSRTEQRGEGVVAYLWFYWYVLVRTVFAILDFCCRWLSTVLQFITVFKQLRVLHSLLLRNDSSLSLR
jgi:hypothetical protein